MRAFTPKTSGLQIARAKESGVILRCCTAMALFQRPDLRQDALCQFAGILLPGKLKRLHSKLTLLFCYGVKLAHLKNLEPGLLFPFLILIAFHCVL